MEDVAVEVVYTPKTSVLINGELINLRLLDESDERALRNFFNALPENELEDLRDDVRDPSTVSHWVQTLDYRRNLPLLALDEAARNIISVATLHFMTRVHRHVAEIRVVVSGNYRKLGLGSLMIKEVIQLGTKMGLHFIQAEILSDNQLAIKAFRQLGFEQLCILEGYFMNRRGQTRDVVMMLKRLRVNMEEDFFFVF